MESQELDDSVIFYESQQQLEDYYDQRDIKAWQDDSNCIICSLNFEEDGVPLIPKNCCKFCFRGVCHACSQKRLPHPVLEGLQRVCDDCFPLQQSQKRSLNNSKTSSDFSEEDPRQRSISVVQKPSAYQFPSSPNKNLNEPSKFPEAIKVDGNYGQESPFSPTNHEQIRAIIRENESLKQELSELDETHKQQIKELLEALEILKHQLSHEERTYSVNSVTEGVDIPTLLKEKEQQAKRIKELQDELQVKEHQLQRLKYSAAEKSMDELSMDPVSQDKCKCSIF